MPLIESPERKLASYETVLAVRPIEGADLIETVTVRGWNVVVKKEENIKVGDRVVYFEIDSALPLDDERFSFLAPRSTRNIDGADYHVLKTARLRGQYSQGLVLPVALFPELPEIKKWEAPVPAGGNMVGVFSTPFAHKSDSERVQNLTERMDDLSAINWTLTEKIDGQSFTIVKDENGVVHYFSRNYEIEVAENSDLWAAARPAALNLENGEALQGEWAGPGIQGNVLKLNRNRLFAFSMFRNGVPLGYDEWSDWAVPLRVPVLSAPEEEIFDSAESMVAYVDGMKSVVNPQVQAEGIVFHADRPVEWLGGRNTFKAINNKFLLKHDKD